MADESAGRVKKLDHILKKTENLLLNLDQIGIDVSMPYTKLKEAKRLYGEKRLDEALKIVEETIAELQKLKKEYTKIAVETPERGRGVYALFRTDEGVDRKQMEEWRLILESWKDDGYRIGNLDEIFSKEPQEVEKVFVEISRNVARSEKYQREISEMLKDPRLPSELRIQVQNILPKLKNVKDFDMVEKKVQELMEEYSRYLSEVKEAKRTIDRLRKEGYNVDRITESFDRDSYDVFKEKYRTFLRSVELLKSAEKKLDEIEADPHLKELLGEKISRIRKLLKDPGKIGEIQRLVKPLLEDVARLQRDKKRILEERALRGNLLEEIDLWERDGFMVEELKKNVDAPLEKLRELRERYVKGIERIKELKRRLLTLDGLGYEEDIASLALSMNDPLKADEYAEQVRDLAERVEERNRVLDHLEKKAAHWKKLGYIVTPIEIFLRNPGRLEEALEYLQKYQNNFRRAITIENEIKDVKAPHLKKLADEIAVLLKNLPNLRPALEKYEKLKELIENEKVLKEKWKTFNKVSRGWMERGYKVEGMLERFLRIKNSPEEIDRLLEEYKRRIAELERLRSEYERIGRGVDKELEEELEEKLWDLEAVGEAKKKLMLLKAKVANREYLRKKMEEFIKKMEEKGIDVTTLRKKMDENPGEVKAIAEEFRDKLREFARVKREIITRLRDEGRKRELQEIKGIKDPYMLDELLKRYSSILKPETLSEHEEVEALLKSAHEEYKKKNYERALELYSKVLEKDPENRKASFFIKRIKVLMKGSNEKSG